MQFGSVFYNPDDGTLIISPNATYGELSESLGILRVVETRIPHWAAQIEREIQLKRSGETGERSLSETASTLSLQGESDEQ